MSKCLNCGKIIQEGFEVCSQKCAKEYFEYVFEEKLADHPEFQTKIAPNGYLLAIHTDEGNLIFRFDTKEDARKCGEEICEKFDAEYAIAKETNDDE
jgi:predicted  nucleic acid-binding Zn-ribbon protein